MLYSHATYMYMCMYYVVHLLLVQHTPIPHIQTVTALCTELIL